MSEEQTKDTLIGAIIRQPFAILGALAFISLIDNILTLQTTLENIVTAFQAVTRPVWEFLLGWLPWDLPGWVADYLTMGMVVSGMWFRALLVENDDDLGVFTFLIAVLSNGLLWPLSLPYFAYVTLDRLRSGKKIDPSYIVFWETGLWAIVLIAINYALIFGGF